MPSDYASAAFARYQVPFGADQCKRMTAWALHVPRADAAPRWNTHDPVRGQRLDMLSRYSGGEGLTSEDLSHRVCFPNSQ
jgi:hypothetical protein